MGFLLPIRKLVWEEVFIFHPPIRKLVWEEVFIFHPPIRKLVWEGVLGFPLPHLLPNVCPMGLPWKLQSCSCTSDLLSTLLTVT